MHQTFSLKHRGAASLAHNIGDGIGERRGDDLLDGHDLLLQFSGECGGSRLGDFHTFAQGDAHVRGDIVRGATAVVPVCSSIQLLQHAQCRNSAPPQTTRRHPRRHELDGLLESEIRHHVHHEETTRHVCEEEYIHELTRRGAGVGRFEDGRRRSDAEADPVGEKGEEGQVL